MKRRLLPASGAVAALAALLPATSADAEILAMANYESKPADSLRALKHPVGEQSRREGIAVIDVDPESETYGEIVMDIPLPPDLVAHHIFYNNDATKAYVTALGKPELRVIDMTQNPYRMETVDVPCEVGEDVVFSADNSRYWLTCLGSNNVVVGDAATGEPIRSIEMPEPYPHGIDIHDGIDRVLVTNTSSPTDTNPGEYIVEVEASTGEVLGTHKVSDQPSPSGVAPVEVLFIPGSNPPVAYVTNMYGNSLWTLTWNPETETFEPAEAFDLGPHDGNVPLEMYVDDDRGLFYVTTAQPGQFHIFDISGDVAKPELVKTLPTAGGAHHVAFTKDGRYGFVQNSLLNLPGMSDGSITVVDLEKQEVLDSVDTLKEAGFNPNSIVLLPEWNDPAGH